MSGRPPNTLDMERMQQALAIVTAYDMGTQESEFGAYMEIISDHEHPEAMMHSLAQFSWLLLRALESIPNVDKEQVLNWYGLKFAQKGEELREQDE